MELSCRGLDASRRGAPNEEYKGLLCTAIVLNVQIKPHHHLYSDKLSKNLLSWLIQEQICLLNSDQKLWACPKMLICNAPFKKQTADMPARTCTVLRVWLKQLSIDQDFPSLA